MSKNYENGIVASGAGFPSDISKDIEVTGDVFWLNSALGNDANAGTNRSEPKATITSAIAAATANNGDLIIIEPSHEETITAEIDVDKAGIRILGLGSGSTKPRFTVDFAGDGFNITANRVELNNLKFPIGTTANNTSRINLASPGSRVFGCVFECGENDIETITIPTAGKDCEINACTFTIVEDGPDSGIEIESATALGLKVIGCQFDGGDFNFDSGAIFSSVSHTEFLYRDNVLINQAHIIHNSESKGQAAGTVMGDGSRLEI